MEREKEREREKENKREREKSSEGGGGRGRRMSEVLTVFFQRCCRCSGEKVGAKEQESRETDREREREREREMRGEEERRREKKRKRRDFGGGLRASGHDCRRSVFTSRARTHTHITHPQRERKRVRER